MNPAKLLLVVLVASCRPSTEQAPAPPPAPPTLVPLPQPGVATPAAPAAHAQRAVPLGITLDPTSPTTAPHAGCFVRPDGFAGNDAICFWTAPGTHEGDPAFQCNTAEAGCEADRARFMEMVGGRVTPCFRRVAAVCTDLVGGSGNRRCYAFRNHCEEVRQQHEGTPCVSRSTF